MRGTQGCSKQRVAALGELTVHAVVEQDRYPAYHTTVGPSQGRWRNPSEAGQGSFRKRQLTVLAGEQAESEKRSKGSWAKPFPHL